MRKFGSVSMIVLAVGLVSPAHAQNASESGLEEIIVTATKRSENLQNVPVAVSAISASARYFSVLALGTAIRNPST